MRPTHLEVFSMRFDFLQHNLCLQNSFSTSWVNWNIQPLGTKQLCINRVGPNIAFIWAGKCYVFVIRLANVNLTQLDQSDLPRILLKTATTINWNQYPSADLSKGLTQRIIGQKNVQWNGSHSISCGAQYGSPPPPLLQRKTLSSYDDLQRKQNVNAGAL